MNFFFSWKKVNKSDWILSGFKRTLETKIFFFSISNLIFIDHPSLSRKTSLTGKKENYYFNFWNQNCNDRLHDSEQSFKSTSCSKKITLFSFFQSSIMTFTFFFFLFNFSLLMKNQKTKCSFNLLGESCYRTIGIDPFRLQLLLLCTCGDSNV